MGARRRSWETIYLTLQPLVINLVGVPAMAYIVRAQGATQYGQWLTAMALVQTMTLMSSLGMRPIFVRTLAQNPEVASVRLGEQITLRAMLGFAGGLIAVGACLALRHPPIVLGCVLIAAIGLVLNGVSECLIDTLHAFEHFTGYANVFMVSGLSLTAASVVVCWLGGGPIALSLSYLVGPVINVLGMGAIVVRRQFRFRPQWNVARFRALLHESRLLGRIGILSSLHERLEQLMLPKMVSPAVFGYFAAGLIPSSRLNVIPSGIITVFYPRIARACKDGTERAVPTVQGLFMAMFLTCLPTTLGVLLFGKWIANILFPREPDLCAWIIHITMWSLPIVGMNWAFTSSLQASGNHDAQARAGIKATLISFAAGAILIAAFGLRGACISWLLRPAAMWVLLMLRFRRVFPGLLGRLPFLRIAAATLIMQGALSLGWRLLGDSLPALCATGLAASVIFLGALVSLKVISLATLRSLARGGKEEPAPRPAVAGS